MKKAISQKYDTICLPYSFVSFMAFIKSKETHYLCIIFKTCHNILRLCSQNPYCNVKNGKMFAYVHEYGSSPEVHLARTREWPNPALILILTLTITLTP